jgi:hypothetical protein
MKVLEWVDDNGCKRKRSIKDTDPDEMAIDGLPFEPPDVINRLDWDNLKVALHNNLFDRGLVCWQDVQKSQNGVTSAILATFRREVLALYKEVQ